jgi:hypothetical protein
MGGDELTGASLQALRGTAGGRGGGVLRCKMKLRRSRFLPGGP